MNPDLESLKQRVADLYIDYERARQEAESKRVEWQTAQGLLTAELQKEAMGKSWPHALDI